VGNDRESAADSLNVIGCFYYAMPFRQSKARCDARLYIKRKQSCVVGLIVRLARALVRWGEEGGGSACLSSSDLVAWCRLTVRHECEDKQSFRISEQIAGCFFCFGCACPVMRQCKPSGAEEAVTTQLAPPNGYCVSRWHNFSYSRGSKH
jgi:hypothetical protein